jgi:hypothetical protein
MRTYPEFRDLVIDPARLPQLGAGQPSTSENTPTGSRRSPAVGVPKSGVKASVGSKGGKKTPAVKPPEDPIADTPAPHIDLADGGNPQPSLDWFWWVALAVLCLGGAGFAFWWLQI